MDNQKQYSHGIHIGFMDNISRKKDYDSHERLKRKTVGSIANIIPLGSDDFFKYNNKGPRQYMTMRFTAFREALRWSINTNENVKWLVLLEAGTIFDKEKAKLFHLWLQQLPPADDTSTAAFTHILMPQDYSYFHINTQMIAINASIARKHRFEISDLLGFSGEMEVGCERSRQDYHDDYTPYWVLPNHNKHTMGVTERSAWLAHLVNKGYSVMNLSNETVRQFKQFFYMDTPEQIQLAQHYGKQRIPDDQLLTEAEAIGKRGMVETFLKTDADMDSNDVCLLQNTSTFPYEWGLNTTVDAVITTCAGLNFARFAMSVPYSKDFQIIHYDNSPIGVRFRENLVKQWNGKDYFDFALSIREENKHYLYIGGKEEFDNVPESIWANIQAAKHTFVLTDLLQDWRDLLDTAKTNGAKNIIFDITNILSFTKTIYRYGFEEPTVVFREIVDYLQENFDNWQLYTDMFSLTNKDIAAYDAAPMEVVNADGIKTDKSAFGYFVYKSKPVIPINAIVTAWESASVDYSTLMSQVDPRRFTYITRTAIQKSSRTTDWNDFFDETYLPAVEMDLPFDHETWAAEAQAAYDAGQFSYHRNEGDTGWCSFVINGIAHGKTKSYESYFPGQKESHDLYSITDEARQHTPSIVDFFENIMPQTYGITAFNRVRIMALEPGGVILPHFDTLTSTQPGPLNMALTHPDNCHFHLWKGSNFTAESYWGMIPFKPGRSFNIDIGNSHTIYNLSDKVRFHMIAHVDTYHEESRKNWYNFRCKSLGKLIRKF